MIISDSQTDQAVAVAKSFILGLMRAGLIPKTKSVAVAFAVSRLDGDKPPYVLSRAVDRIQTDLGVTNHRVSHEKNKDLVKKMHGLTTDAHKMIPGTTAADLFNHMPFAFSHGDPVECGSVNHNGLIVSVAGDLPSVWFKPIAEVVAQTLMAMAKLKVDQARTSARENDSAIIRNI